MTPNEFKAWFDGFIEAFDKPPSQKQWARIKERVAEIDGKPVTERVFIDRYYPQYVRPWVTGFNYPIWGPFYSTTNTGGTSTQTAIGGRATSDAGWAQHYQNAIQNGASVQQQMSSNYNSTHAMAALGRSEAQAMS